MPPGNTRLKPPNKVIEKLTARACLAVAQRVEQAHHLAGDEIGAEAARQVAYNIEVEVLEGWLFKGKRLEDGPRPQTLRP